MTDDNNKDGDTPRFSRIAAAKRNEIRERLQDAAEDLQEKAEDLQNKADDQLDAASSSFFSQFTAHRKIVRQNLREVVDSTNRRLEAVEERANATIRKPIEDQLESFQDARDYLRQARRLLNHRNEYHLYAATGMALTAGTMAGGIVAMRRGRLPGALSGVVTSGVSYLALATYDFKDDEE